MSASSRPTRAPWSAQARARFTATVDLPTPPLPEATATTLRIEPSGLRLRRTACAWVSARSPPRQRGGESVLVVPHREAENHRGGKAARDGTQLAQRLRLAEGLAEIGV